MPVSTDSDEELEADMRILVDEGFADVVNEFEDEDFTLGDLGEEREDSVVRDYEGIAGFDKVLALVTYLAEFDRKENVAFTDSERGYIAQLWHELDAFDK